MTIFPLNEYWSFYAGFIVFVLFILALDLGVFHKKAKEVSLKEAFGWTAVWIAVALLFNVGLYYYTIWFYGQNLEMAQALGKSASEIGKDVGLEFLTGYIIEKTLAIDNIFVFAVVFSYFNIPKIYQHRILFWGIIGALVFRAVFVALGSVLMKYEWVIIFFGVLLMITGFKMYFAGQEQKSLDQNILIKFLKKIFRIHPVIEGPQFFVKKDNRLFATPLFLALVFLELSDVIFAIDSVPAIFAITKEPFIVFTSNILALLGLRSMYFLLLGVLDRFAYIKYGLATVLIFVGAKMVYLNHLFGGKFPISLSLAIIVTIMGSSILYSIYANRKSLKA